jgi:hypothetical protein
MRRIPSFCIEIVGAAEDERKDALGEALEILRKCGLGE